MPYKDFYELDAWKRAREFKLKMYAVIRRFPAHERYELASQLRRAARSIPANVSEGHGRKTARDEYSFCTIARGSLSECLNHLIDAWDCAYINREELSGYKEEWDSLRKVLNGYMSFIQSKIPARTSGEKQPDVQDCQVAYVQTIAAESRLEDFFNHLQNYE